MMNPGWILLVDPQRGDQMWHQVASTEHVEDGWRVTASCGREVTMEAETRPMASVPEGGVVCAACVTPA